jgi:hypothetical protein
MFGHPHYYHSLIRKYVAIFGAMFNDIHVMHDDVSGNPQDIIVPVAYGPRARYIERRRMEPDLQNNRVAAIVLPRIAFEIVDFRYAADRKTNTLNRICGIERNSFVPVPYDIVFQLSVISRTVTDGNQIAEQIIPNFTPSLTISAELLDGSGEIRDIPITLNNIQFTDTYADDWMQREICLWEFTFTMQAWFYGYAPDKTSQKVIKFANVTSYPITSNTYAPNADAKYLRVLVQPGLTANGTPTTDITQTIPYQQIESDDDWDFIVRVEER